MSTVVTVQSNATTSVSVTTPAAETDFTVASATSTTEIETTGGAPGPAGRNGDAPTVDAIAGEAIGGHRAVFVGSDGKMYLAAAATAAATRPVGITSSAFAAEAQASAQTGGTVQESSWSWSPGPIYLGENGLLTQTAPMTGAIYLMGVAIGATRISITPQLVAKL